MFPFGCAMALLHDLPKKKKNAAKPKLWTQCAECRCFPGSAAENFTHKLNVVLFAAWNHNRILRDSTVWRFWMVESLYHHQAWRRRIGCKFSLELGFPFTNSAFCPAGFARLVAVALTASLSSFLSDLPSTQSSTTLTANHFTFIKHNITHSLTACEHVTSSPLDHLLPDFGTLLNGKPDVLHEMLIWQQVQPKRWGKSNLL